MAFSSCFSIWFGGMPELLDATGRTLKFRRTPVEKHRTILCYDEALWNITNKQQQDSEQFLTDKHSQSVKTFKWLL